MKKVTLSLNTPSELHLWSSLALTTGETTSPIQLIMLGLIKGKWSTKNYGEVLISGDGYSIHITNEKLTLAVQEKPSAQEKGKDNATM